MSIYGNPVTLGPRWLTAKKVSILPFQNLHGYDHPWPAGGGKNLADPSKIYLMSIGSAVQGWIYIDMPDGNYRTLKVDQLSAGTYTISTTLTDSYFIRYRYTVNDSITGVNIQSRTNNYTFTLTDDVTDFGISFCNTTSTVITESFVVQLESGSPATSYAPYSNICPISGWEDCRIWVSPTPDPADGTTYRTVFGNPPGTVYGGELDLETGVLTVDRAMVDMGTLDWNAGASVDIFWLRSTSGIATNWVRPASDDDAVDFICSKYQAIPFDERGAKASGIWWHIGSGQYIGIRDPNYINWTTADVKSDLSGVPLIVRLKSPVTYQLTPQQISVFSNQYFGANCGPVLVKIGKQ